MQPFLGCNLDLGLEMDSDTRGKLMMMFVLYGSLPEITDDSDIIDTIYGTYTSGGITKTIPYQRTVQVKMRFDDESLERFADDLIRIYKIEKEETIRNQNPAAKQAYEEYQLILKLIK